MNVRGLKSNKNKCIAIINSVDTKYQGTIFLQETHSRPEIEKIGKQNEWDGDIVFAHGSSKSKGLAILFPKTTK